MLEVMMSRVRSLAILLLLTGLSIAMKGAAEEPVKIIASYVTELHTPSGTVKLPFDVSLDWSKPQPSITRAILLLHGKGRDVDGYYKGLQRAAGEAGWQHPDRAAVSQRAGRGRSPAWPGDCSLADGSMGGWRPSDWTGSGECV
jgi:pimeloyl-ACP methyl ester carboxylesterase